MLTPDMRPVCPMFQDQCRFCSNETLRVPYTHLITNPKTKRLEAGAIAIREVSLGTWCNNISQWVSELRYCPGRWGLYGIQSSGVRADGCGVYSDTYGQSQIPKEDEFVVSGIGQQVLGI